MTNEQLGELYNILIGNDITLAEAIMKLDLDPEAVLADPDTVTEIETMIFVCDACGHWFDPQEADTSTGEMLCADCGRFEAEEDLEFEDEVYYDEGDVYGEDTEFDFGDTEDEE